MSTRRGDVLEGELVDVNPAVLNRALALPQAKNVALPDYFDTLLDALDKCDKLDHVRQIKDHAEEAAICARRLKDGDLIEKARKITAYTWRKMGEELGKIPDGRATVTPLHAGKRAAQGPSPRAQAAQRAGITPTAARRATNIASIDRDVFRDLVEQPGSCSTRVLDDVARDQRRAGGSPTSAGQRAAGLKRHAMAKISDFSQFTVMHDAKSIAKLFGGDAPSMRKAATNTREWLSALIRALG